MKMHANADEAPGSPSCAPVAVVRAVRTVRRRGARSCGVTAVRAWIVQKLITAGEELPEGQREEATNARIVTARRRLWPRLITD